MLVDPPRRLHVVSAVSIAVLLASACQQAGIGDATDGAQGGVTGGTMGAGGPSGAEAMGGLGSGGSGGASTGGGAFGSGSRGGGAGEPAGGGAVQGTGGASSGGTAGLGGDLIEPNLIVSAPGEYWQEGEATPSVSGEPTLTVGLSEIRQTWYGFGGKFSEMGWYSLLELTLEQRQEVMSLLFDSTLGIGFDWGRLPIGPDDHAVERYALSDAPGEFDALREELYLVPYVQAAREVKEDLMLWAVPWSPPAWAKQEGTADQNGFDKGLFDVSQAGAYADYLVSWIEAYENQDIPIAFIMPQNEPGFSTSLPTCAFGPAIDTTQAIDLYSDEPVSLGPFVAEALAVALEEAALSTKVWFGALGNNATFEDYWGSLSDKSLVEGVGVQGELYDRVSALQQQGLLVMQSLHWPGNAPFRHETATSREDADRNNFLPTQAPNNHAYGEESWDLLKDWIDRGVNLYMAGNFILDSYGFNLDVVRRWPQNALIAVDREAATFEVTPAYYVFRHVAQYVEREAVVLTINGNALAFRNPDGGVVAIVFNEEEEEAPHTIDIGGTLLDFVVPGRGWATVNFEP